MPERGDGNFLDIYIIREGKVKQYRQLPHQINKREFCLLKNRIKQEKLLREYSRLILDIFIPYVQGKVEKCSSGTLQPNQPEPVKLLVPIEHDINRLIKNCLIYSVALQAQNAI